VKVDSLMQSVTRRDNIADVSRAMTCNHRMH